MQSSKTVSRSRRKAYPILRHFVRMPCTKSVLVASLYTYYVGRFDAAALYGTEWSRGGGRPAAGARCPGAGQDQERSGTATHGRPGRPRVLLSTAALPQGANRRRHRGTPRPQICIEYSRFIICQSNTSKGHGHDRLPN